MKIDRLTLEVPPMSEHDARRLPALIAQALQGSAPTRAAVTVEHRDEPLERLAERIARELRA